MNIFIRKLKRLFFPCQQKMRALVHRHHSVCDHTRVLIENKGQEIMAAVVESGKKKYGNSRKVSVAS